MTESYRPEMGTRVLRAPAIRMSRRVQEALLELADEGALHLHNMRHVGSFEDCRSQPCPRNRHLLYEGKLPRKEPPDDL